MHIIINICQFHVMICASFDKLYVNNQSYYLKAKIIWLNYIVSHLSYFVTVVLVKLNLCSPQCSIQLISHGFHW